MAQLAKPVVSFVLERITNLLIEEGRFLHGVSDQVKQLHSDLKLMHSLLNDADSRQDEAAVVREWISQSKDLAYEVENVLETYAFKLEATRRRGITKVLKRYSCILNECYTRHKVGLEIQSLNNRVSTLTKRFQEYGIRVVPEKEGPSSRQNEYRRMYSHIEEDDFVGLESDVETLVKHLVDENHGARVASISGMGGLGKTTIARKVYNHSKLKRHFDCFAWVCVSQQWAKKDLLQGILIKISPEKRHEIEKWRDEELIRELSQALRHRRYFIVIDDIWSADAWDAIRHGFPTGETQGKILVTTRNKDLVVHIAPNGYHHEPRFLNDDESWELFRKKAMREQLSPDYNDIHEKEKLGREMVKFCQGLPLAVVVLGGILATKYSSNEWSNVRENVKAYLGRGEGIEQPHGEVQKILALSYDDLPYQLKPCFLYLSTFFEDEEIETEILYEMWMAEGMVLLKDRIGGESLMNTAERYLGELAKRCMVQVEPVEVPLFTRMKTCRLHDLMRDLCSLKAEEESFSKVIDYRLSRSGNELINNPESSKLTRRLIIKLGEKDVSNYIAPKKATSLHVRSLRFSILDWYLVWLARPIKSQFNNFKMLRILTIEGLYNVSSFSSIDDWCRFFLDYGKLPNAIGKLIHLRYFCLKDCIFLTLPSSIGNLEHLETLDLRGFDSILLPNVLWKLRQLRHLYLPEDLASICPEDLASICPKRRRRLNGLVNLEILRNLDDKVFEVKDVHGLTNLRVLTASLKNYENAEEIINYLSNSTNQLREVSLKVKAFYHIEREMAASLVQKLLLCPRLHQLEVQGPFRRLPEYSPDFSLNVLVDLSILDAEIEEDPMEILEKLPNLRHLYLYNSYVGREMVCHAMGFPKLKVLRLALLKNLANVVVEQGAMPNLHHLGISQCDVLKMIPEGLRFLTSLKELEVRNMPTAFEKRLQVIDGEEGEDLDKVRNVNSIILK